MIVYRWVRRYIARSNIKGIHCYAQGIAVGIWTCQPFKWEQIPMMALVVLLIIIPFAALDFWSLGHENDKLTEEER